MYIYSVYLYILLLIHPYVLIADRNVTVNGLHPGTVVTDFYRYYVPFPQLYPFCYFLFFPLLYLLPTQVEGSQTQIWASVDESLEGVSGKYLL